VTTDRSDWISRRIRVAVGQRLLLGLAPSLLAVALVVALGYYGEIGREAPEYVVSGAAALALFRSRSHGGTPATSCAVCRDWDAAMEGWATPAWSTMARSRPATTSIGSSARLHD
jgi:hypothetical protein